MTRTPLAAVLCFFAAALWAAGTTGRAFAASAPATPDTAGSTAVSAAAVAPPSSDAGGFIRADASVEPDHVTFGDTLEYRVTVRWKGDYTIDQIDPPDSMQDFLVVSRGVPDTTDSAVAGGGEFRQTFLLRAVGTGALEVPPFVVRYHQAANTPDTISPSAARVQVGAAKGGKTQGKLEPLAPAQAIPFDWTLRNLMIGGGAVLFLALGFVAWILFRRFEQQRVANRPPPPPLPAHVLAYQELDALAHTTYLRDGRFKLFFTELSEIVRRYIQNRYGQPALDWTSYEILQALAGRNEPPQEERQKLDRLFQTCDMVKFAKWTPPEGTGEWALDESIRFVDATYRVSPEPVPTAPTVQPAQEVAS